MRSPDLHDTPGQRENDGFDAADTGCKKMRIKEKLQAQYVSKQLISATYLRT